MTRKQHRSVLIFSALATLGLAAFLVLTALRDTVVFFYSPSEVAEKSVATGQRFRLGGLVAEKSFQKLANTEFQFDIADGNKTIQVRYSGLLPDLFREGQGVVAEGMLLKDGRFHADSVLAKHDENYMPREVAESLKKQGHWQGETQKQ
ncbi:MAG TPA: cytochrome c maturation protein CcmE [Hyphomicrobiales bacterium]|nr:cytochrome c maturation protein CcmE [Hyphomicrobiales bacterium]